MPAVEMYHPDLKLHSNRLRELSIVYSGQASSLPSPNLKGRKEVQNHAKLKIQAILNDTGRYS